MTDQKSAWGGKRPGSGRKKKEETITTGFRINAKALAVCRKLYGRSLNSKINHFIKELAKEALTNQ